MYVRCPTSSTKRRHGGAGRRRGGTGVGTCLPALPRPLSDLMVLSTALILPMGDPRRVTSAGRRQGAAESMASLELVPAQINSDL